MFTKTVSEVSKITGASQTHIRGLITRNVLKAQRHDHHGPKGFIMLIECESTDALKSIVSGSSKKPLGRKRKTATKYTPIKSSASLQSRLNRLASWTSMPDDKRQVLIDLADKFTAAELECLLSL